MSKGKVKVVLTKDGCAELRCSPEAKALVREIAEEAMGRLGDGYKVTVGVHKGVHRRAFSRIHAIWNQTKAHEPGNAILKALK